MVTVSGGQKMHVVMHTMQTVLVSVCHDLLGFALIFSLLPHVTLLLKVPAVILFHLSGFFSSIFHWRHFRQFSENSQIQCLGMNGDV